ncbi:MAG: PIG-L family deacetylase [Candidatus Omnitrophica bacterium]|nr:PIG-L family deacetylase [Candidatus Omnitrophota bacterium]MDD5690854.1 PIG-L family deacetylase [Candidatus Omnitrophota bacterium]
MHKYILSVMLLFLLLVGCASIEKSDLAYWSEMPILEPFKKGERVLILAPHPDDEAIACAGVIQQALKAGAKIRIVYLTNGDHNELAFIVYEKRITVRQGEFVHMGKVRQQESIKAMKYLGLPEEDLVFLGYPDYGTFNIFSQYWQTKKPFRDRLTRISSVPYKDNPSYGAEYCGESILDDLSRQILNYKPDKIFVSHPADVNVDHKSLYLFLQVALSDLEGKIAKPKVYPYLVHCVGWPKPRHYHPELELRPPDKFIDSEISWSRADLSFGELDKKYQSILFYKSQTQSSAFYLFSFARENELFGDYPPLELAPQQTLKDKVISYFGASKMFKDAPGVDTVEGKTIEADGQVSYAEEDSYFVARVDKPKKLSNRFSVLLYVFGYSRNTAFPAMPKIRIITAGKKLRVFNGQKRVVNSGVIFEFGRNYLVIKIPLKLLGEPDYVLTALKAFHGNLPIDAVGFRKVKVRK